MECPNAGDCANFKPKPAPDPHDLGEWRGWRLRLCIGGRVAAEKYGELSKAYYWKPGDKMPAERPEACNALLEAHRRAVKAGLATWPAGWECFADEMPSGESGNWHATGCVWLGRNYVAPNEVKGWCAWPCSDGVISVIRAESRRRASLLGLCEAEQSRPACPVQVGDWVGPAITGGIGQVVAVRWNDDEWEASLTPGLFEYSANNLTRYAVTPLPPLTRDNK